jgi:hypothetical protein
MLINSIRIIHRKRNYQCGSPLGCRRLYIYFLTGYSVTNSFQQQSSSMDYTVTANSGQIMFIFWISRKIASDIAHRPYHSFAPTDSSWATGLDIPTGRAQRGHAEYPQHSLSFWTKPFWALIGFLLTYPPTVQSTNVVSTFRQVRLSPSPTSLIIFNID